MKVGKSQRALLAEGERRAEIITTAIAEWRAAGSPDYVWRCNGHTLTDTGLLAAWRAADLALRELELGVANLGEVRAIYNAPLN